MKVLIDAHAAIQKKTGIGRYADNLIENLPKASGEKIKISLYTHHPTLKKFKKFPQYCAPFKNGVFRVFFGLNWAIAKLKPDIIHISNFAPFIKTAPIVMTVHDLCFKTCPDKYPLKTRLAFGLFFTRSLKMADAIICVSKSVRKDLLRFYNVSPEKTFTVYEAPDSFFKPIKEKKKIRNALQRKFRIEKKFFLVVGNIEPRKKPFETIEAFLKLKRNDVQLVFAGPNLLGKSLLKKYKEDIEQEKIRILEFISDKELKCLYNCAVALIYNSHCEGFGLPLLEIMQCKRPVICSDIDVFKEVVGKTALIVKNKRDLANTIERVLSNGHFQRKFTSSGLRRSKKFSWGKTAKETLRVYKQVLSQA